MKYKITIEHEPQSAYPYLACAKVSEGDYRCGSGKTPEEAEKDLINRIKEYQIRQPTITKEIEI